MAIDPTQRKLWFTSDLHFHHKRIVELSERPWDDVAAMNEGMVQRWNECVALTDMVYVIGDFSFGSKAKQLDIIERLNGEKALIRGNHDYRDTAAMFEWERDLYTVKVADPDAPKGVQRIVLCHYPLLVWDQRQYGAWHLHGHSHGNLEDDPKALRLDVGVDCHDYRPISYEQVRSIMQAKPCWPCSVPVDHHEERAE